MRHHRCSRIVTAAALAFPMLTLGACADTGEPASSSSPVVSATPSSTGTTGVAWAGSVCTSLTAVKADIASIGDGLRIELDATDSALDQVKSQLATDVASVRDSLDEFKAALASAPVEPGADDLSATLESQSGDVEAAVRDAADAANEAANATSGTAFLAAAGTALTSLSDASAATQTYTATMKDAVAQATADLRSAFAEAPACEDLLATT